MQNSSEALEPTAEVTSEQHEAIVEVEESQSANENLADSESTDGQDSSSDEENLAPQTVEFAGQKFDTLEKAAEAFKHMQSRSTKAEVALKQLKENLVKQEEFSKVKDMTETDQLKYLIEKMNKTDEVNIDSVLESLNEPSDNGMQEAVANDDKLLAEYITGREEFKTYPSLEKVFKAIAQANREVKLDELYTHEIAPLIQDLAGKKVVTKKRNAPTGKAPEAGSGSVKNITKADWANNRNEYMTKHGFKI